MTKTKIVCTIGPSSRSPETIEAMIHQGMNVARLNFSHGTHEEHGEKIRLIREVSSTIGKPVAILQDLCGPKIRIGSVPSGGLSLKSGQQIRLTGEQIPGTVDRISVSHKGLPSDVQSGDRILLADGMMEVVVDRVRGMDIECTVITGGVLTSHKGVNLPTRTLNLEAITDKDRRDLAFGLQNGVDFVALSFVRSSADIEAVKALIRAHGKQTPVVAKIEKHEALEVVDQIISVADAVMVARGDLGVEIPLETVPNIQKRLIHKSNAAGKPVIIATQMLRSMVDSPRPTRAEAADVANGVMDGADAVMLSEETASGNYPVEAVRYMSVIARSAEERYPHGRFARQMPGHEIGKSVAAAACTLADHVRATAIVATTRSGATADHIARFRPKTPILALSPDEQTIRRLCLTWGCVPCYLKISEDTDEMVERAAEAALETGRVKKGDVVVITAGRPLWAEGTTNLLWVKKL